MSVKPIPYVLSAWVRRADDDRPTYDDGTLSIKIEMEDDNNPGTLDEVTLLPSGPIIEGWQRIEGEFYYNGEPWVLHFIVGTAEDAYFDDIRIFPAKANMQSYVYDVSSYNLTEILDNNNYYTRYVYDSEGNLVSIKKETAEGIRSLQESRTFVKDTQ